MAVVVSKTSVYGSLRTASVVPRRQIMPRRAVVLRTAVAEEVSTSELVDVIKQAVKEVRSVPGAKVLQTMLALEKQKLQFGDKEHVFTAKGTHWKLEILAGKKAVTAAMKGDESKGTFYNPIVAAQNFDAASKDFENGIFISNVAYLTFSGPYFFDGKIMTFDVTKMNIGVGPWKASFNLKPESPLSSLPEDPKEASTAAKKAKLPFFSYIYLDEDIVVGRGRSGGLAVWSRTDTDWEAQNGVLNVYGGK